MIDTARRTALVLGAGGMTGAAWEIGVLWGLAEAGMDLSEADLVVGSSAGAVVAAQVVGAGMALGELYEGQFGEAEGELPARLRPGQVLRYALAVLGSRTPEEYGRKLGRLASAADTVAPEARRAVVAGRLGGEAKWPEEPRLLITAVDADSGALTAFDRAAGVPLVDAVTASCAIPGAWPVVELAGRRWIDGGLHSTANAHLAAGYERVVIVAPSAARNRALHSPARQAAALAAAGARVEVITPDAESKRAFGRDRFDLTRRGPAARAGRAQAAAHANAVGVLWAL
ncbi:patatin-like phospholipase family protein [Streptomyces sp. SKN60]|uniref:patatin-like phospholipase family protein n=1 Tax=Streptomyces sp. SKN60 TaxID=2855506 RepID=UPI0022475672|nr:patatin-like phospholipase family protein [Streptomyces sp. SKN60]MCX2183726.1 patatin-like phospholipase family protein [Streptomyces sp. SKN60]